MEFVSFFILSYSGQNFITETIQTMSNKWELRFLQFPLYDYISSKGTITPFQT